MISMMSFTDHSRMMRMHFPAASCSTIPESTVWRETVVKKP